MNLGEISAIDQHAHNLLKPEIASHYPYPISFTEGYDPDLINAHARHSLFYRRSLREIAQLLQCEPTEAAILECRQELGLEQLTQHCFQAANLEAIFLDDGFLADDVLPWQWHEQFIPVKRLLRLEHLAENLIVQEEHFDDFLDRFRSEIDPPRAKVVAFKSIAAYRTGLEIQAIQTEAAQWNFYELKRESHGKRLRLNNKFLIDFLITHTLEIAAKHQVPVQFHTGFGDPDLDLRLANPLYLREFLEDSRWRNVPIILLHGAYPYTREAGYLASVYPQVYVDFGLAVPFLSVAGMRSLLKQLLELTPTSKLLYSSDAHNIPELYYLGAKWGREILGSVLEEAVRDSDLTVTEADAIAAAILRENARELYRV
jgi:uncharacterized protein